MKKINKIFHPRLILAYLMALISIYNIFLFLIIEYIDLRAGVVWIIIIVTLLIIYQHLLEDLRPIIKHPNPSRLFNISIAFISLAFVFKITFSKNPSLVVSKGLINYLLAIGYFLLATILTFGDLWLKGLKKILKGGRGA